LTEEEFENNVKISFRDAQGNKIADLKALHLAEAQDTSEIPTKFLEARAKAKELAWGKTGSIELGNVTVETVFLGAPNVVLENGVEKWQHVDESLIEDSGMWDGSKLTTKNGTKGIRTDLLKDINKKVPFVIVKVVNTLIAYPVRGGKVASNMAETFTEKGGKLALKINETLVQNGKKPAQIYYNSETDQNMYSEDGTPTQELQDALDRVNSITTESTNIAEAEINIDLNGIPFLAPKMSINLDSFQTVNIQPKTSPSQSGVEAKKADVESKLGHKDNVQLFKNFVSILREFKKRFPNEARIISENSEVLKVFIVGGTTDVNRNNESRGDLDVVFLHQNEVDNSQVNEFGAAIQKLQYFITDMGNNTQQPAIESNLRPSEKSSPISISDIIAVELKTVEESVSKKAKRRLNLQGDYFTLDFKVYAYFRDDSGNIYTKEVGEINRAKTMSNMAKTLPKSEQEKVKQAWTKQPSNYFENEDFEKVVPDVSTTSRTKQGKKNKDKEC
jgi:hypothetical protein